MSLQKEGRGKSGNLVKERTFSMRSWIKPGRRGVSVLLALGVLLGVLTWAVEPGFFFAQDKAGGPNLPPELAVVPPDAFAFVQIRPADLWGSEFVTKLRKYVPEEMIKGLTEFVDVADLESVAFVVSTAGSIPKMFGGSSQPKATKGFDKFPPDKGEKPPPMKEKFGDKEKPNQKKFDEKPINEKKSDDKESSPVSLVTSAQGEKEDGPDSPEASVLLIFTTIKPYDQAKAKKLLGPGASVEQKYKEKSFLVGARKSALYFLNDKTYVLAFSEVAPWETPGNKAIALMKQILDRPEQARAQGPLAAALDLAANKRHAVVGVNFMDPQIQKEMKHAVAELNKPWRQDPFWTLVPLVNTRTAALALDVKEGGVQLEGNLTYSDPERADDALGAAQDALALARILLLGRVGHQLRSEIADGETDPQMHIFSLLCKQAESALRKTTVERRLAAVQIKAQVQIDLDALEAQAKITAKAAAKGEGYVPRRLLIESNNNIKTLVLCLHACNDTYFVLPPTAICSKENGKPLLSWRVAILPFVDQPGLYRQFKLDEPWDSETNIKLLPLMPKVYAPVRGKTAEPFTTFYQAFAGKNTAFEINPDKTAMWGALGTSIPRSFTDGTSQTIGIVEAGEAVPWTKPADVPFDAAKPLPKLGGIFNGAFHVGMMDGSVRFFRGVAKEGVEPKDAPPGFVTEKTLRAAITRNGGEPLGPDWFQD